jgi:hypothetical protein
MSMSPDVPRSSRGRPAFAAALALALALASGCHALKVNPPPDKPGGSPDNATPAPPAKYSLRVAPYVFLSDVEITRDQPLFEDLAGLRDQVTKELQLPVCNSEIKVYLFEDRDRYERFMQARYPDLPRRRAFFIAQPRGIGGAEDLLVYTFWDDRVERVRQDLRHELTHGLLHGVIRDVPIWLDEGLAEYFEVQPDRKGVNAAHLDKLRNGPSKPDLARLEGLNEVEQMRPDEYREAWAWVHLMLRDRPEAKAALVSYLRDLRGATAPGPIGPRLGEVYKSPEDALDRHLARLESSARAEASPQR